MTVLDKLRTLQIGAEISLAACVYTLGELPKDTKLDGVSFIDDEIGKFFSSVSSGKSPIEAMPGKKLLDDILNVMSDGSVVVTKYREYSRVIKACNQKARVFRELAKVANGVTDDDVVEMKKKIAALAESIEWGSGKSIVDIPCAAEVNAEMGARLTSGQSFLNVVKTGINKWDNNVSGLVGGRLYIVSGVPGSGKTALALQILTDNPQLSHNGDDFRELFFSIEMRKEAAWQRISCGYAKVNATALESSTVSQTELEAVAAAGDALAARCGDNLLIVDDERTLDGIIETALVVKPNIVIVDHLEEMSVPRELVRHKATWYDTVLRELRDEVAKPLNIPVVVIHQMNRDIWSRSNGTPKMADLDFSGEKLADLVCFVHRFDLFSDNVLSSGLVPVNIIIAKNRYGPVLTLQMDFDLLGQKFTSLP